LQDHISGQWRTSPDPVSALTEKLGEEYGEFCAQRDPAELFDLLDVIMELRVLLDPLREHGNAHFRKRERLGGFSRHQEWHPDPVLDLWKVWEGGPVNEEEDRQVRSQGQVP
jgi:predicted house-cleaning noncanonical NTP pyrophosphatase (MazG superfamily)